MSVNDVFIVDQTVSCILRKQNSAQGSLHELETIIERNKVPSTIKSILNHKQVRNDIFKHNFWKWLTLPNNRTIDLPLPVVLSAAQSQVIENAANSRGSVVMGPPGPGKSFTIASLALKEFSQGVCVGCFTKPTCC